MTAKEIFGKVYGKPNLLTPDVIRYGEGNNVLYELSKGELIHKMIYGVSVIERHGDALITDSTMSQMFYNLENAELYIKEITT